MRIAGRQRAQYGLGYNAWRFGKIVRAAPFFKTARGTRTAEKLDVEHLHERVDFQMHNHPS